MPKIIAAGVGLPLIGTGATVTTSQPLLDLSQRWNNVATTFTGLKLNVTDTTSASGSLLMDLQVGAATKFNVSKAGVLTLTGATAVTLTPGAANLLTLNGGLTAGASLTVPAANYYNFSGRGGIGASADGVFVHANAAGTNSFTMTAGASGLVTFGGSIIATGSLNVGTANAIRWASSTNLAAPTDGALSIRNNATTNTVTLTVGAANLLTLNGGLKTTGATFALQTATALTDNAAAQLATMTNGPTAGNPTKWIAINDNGTTRYIPAW